jgi:hypothetical protein
VGLIQQAYGIRHTAYRKAIKSMKTQEMMLDEVRSLFVKKNVGFVLSFVIFNHEGCTADLLPSKGLFSTLYFFSLFTDSTTSFVARTKRT